MDGVEGGGGWVLQRYHRVDWTPQGGDFRQPISRCDPGMGHQSLTSEVN